MSKSGQDLDECPHCGEVLDPHEADGKFDPKQVVYTDADMDDHHLGCSGNEFGEIYATAHDGHDFNAETPTDSDTEGGE